MSKVRIYELARELGVENKEIISIASKLGLQGKSSHSSSLESDEAEQIRRSIIRKAVGSAAETVTTRIDASTGEAEAIVEKRKGNVIRRRRQAVSEDDVSSVSEEPQPLAASSERVSEGAASGMQEVATGEHSSESVSGGASAEDLAKHGTNGTQHAETDTGVQSLGSSVEALSETQQDEAVDSPEEPIEEEGSEVDPANSGVSGVEEKAPKVGGPRILGTISLPQKVKPVTAGRVDGKRVVSQTTSGRIDDSDDDDSGKSSKKKDGGRKGRRREISRFDLVDYDGREMRRPKSGRARGDKRAESETLRPDLEATKPKASKRIVKMTEMITVGELAKQMSLKVSDVIANLMGLGVMATINQSLDFDTASIVAGEFEFQVESVGFDESSILADATPDLPEQLVSRPPVVTVMGHVDHGKTTLLDTIRKSSVAEKEHGGITQHIGAYVVDLEDGRRVTFIDTPGHAAFTHMRARGAKVTDIVVLVVAADDGVMPQTVEAISHAKAAGVPIVVAVNKVDKPGANLDRIRQQLVEHGLQPEEWGGDTMFFNVSALKGQGISELLEGILLVAEIKELRANPDKRARGVVVDAKQDKGRGTVATILVQEGTLKIGDLFVTGAEYGRVRSMLDYRGSKMESAGPGVPVEITGMAGIPEAGDDFVSVESEAKAKQVSSERAHVKLEKERRALGNSPLSLEEFARRSGEQAAELNVIVKADVHGSLEAVVQALENLETEKVKVRVVHSAVGGINESDVQLAVASSAVIIGFGVRGEARALNDADSKGVDVRFYRIIYELLDEVKLAMAGLLAPIRHEVRLGQAEVRETFGLSKVGTVAGCYVTDGTVKRNALVRLLREDRVIYEGILSSLKRFKDDVKEVQSGFECGLMIDGYNDLKQGDLIEAYEVKETAATL